MTATSKLEQARRTLEEGLAERRKVGGAREAREHLKWLLAWVAQPDEPNGPNAPGHWAHEQILAARELVRAGELRARPTADPRYCSRGDGRQAYRAGLCQACYRAEKHAPRAAPGEGARLDEVRLPASWLRAIELAAKRQKVTVAQWRREAYRGALLQQALGDRRLAEVLARALEPR